MSVIFIVVDDKGNIVRFDRRDEQGILEKLQKQYFANEFAAAGTTYHVTADQNIHRLHGLYVAIQESERLSAEQRAAALQRYNEITPGDAIHVVNERVFIAQGGDEPKPTKPLFTVFVDP